MPQIRKDNQPVTQITVVESEPGKQEEALSLMVERARFMARQPGFISISLHRSLDGRRIVNYIQWQSRDLLRAAHHSPEFRVQWRHFDELAGEIEPQLYDVALVMDGEEGRPGSAGTSRNEARPASATHSGAKRAAPPRRSVRTRGAKARLH